MMCTSLIGVCENILQKIYDPVSQYECSSCKSKRLVIDSDESNEDGIVQKLFLKCDECETITEVIF